MRKWLAMSVLAVVFVLGGVRNSEAVRPSGWAFHNGHYAYLPAHLGWFFFNTSDTQWVVNLGTGAWGTIDGLAEWVFHNWPYAYSHNTGTWHWFNTPDVQWVHDMSGEIWSLLGHDPPPNGMMTIPHGTNAGTDPDFGAYSLTVNTYYMDDFLVTKAVWDDVRLWGLLNGYTDLPVGQAKATAHPLHSVSWYDAVKWCNARSEREGRIPAYYTAVPGKIGQNVYRTGYIDIQSDWVRWDRGYRLPTDVEWEYAARGGVASRRFPWGDSDEIQHARANYYSLDNVTYDTSPTRGYHPNYALGGFPYTSPVGSFAANGYGLYDMKGNLNEWCFDWYPGHENFYRVMRSGSWEGNTRQVGFRDWYAPAGLAFSIGFRTVLPAQ